MTTMILLSANDAEAVRGPSDVDAYAALEPRPLTDGRFILPAAVLDDPAHVEHRALLAALPTADVDELAALLPADL